MADVYLPSIRTLSNKSSSSTLSLRTRYDCLPCCLSEGQPPIRSLAANKCLLEQISAVKEKISAEKGWDPKSQKLIYSGLTKLAFAPSHCTPGSDLA